jgi:hypothetical protein
MLLTQQLFEQLLHLSELNPNYTTWPSIAREVKISRSTYLFVSVLTVFKIKKILIRKTFVRSDFNWLLWLLTIN